MAMSKPAQVRSPLLLQTVLLVFALAWCMGGASGSEESTAAAMEAKSQPSDSASQTSFVARRLSQTTSTGDQKLLFGCTPSANCSAPRTCCSSLLFSSCTDLKTDVFNCGVCGKTCLVPLNQCCNGVCTNALLGNDPKNCGFCGKVCKGNNPKCLFGFCNDY